MSRMTGVTWNGEHGSTLMSRYDIVCFHTIVGRDPANAAHFSVGGDGKITQSRDTRYRSAANLNGNHRVIAVETEDLGPDFPVWDVNDGHAVPAWTSAQLESNARILAWAHKAHNIPLVLAPDSKSTSRGVAYHRMGVDGNFEGYAYGGRVANGERWSSAFGKVCPGDRRIKQLIEIVIPRARVLAGLDSAVSIDFNQRIGKDSSLAAQFADYQNKSGTLGHWFRGQRQYVAGTREIVTNIEKKIDALSVVDVEIDYDTLADKVVERMGSDLATQVADELYRRMQM